MYGMLNYDIDKIRFCKGYSCGVTADFNHENAHFCPYHLKDWRRFLKVFIHEMQERVVVDLIQSFTGESFTCFTIQMKHPTKGTGEAYLSHIITPYGEESLIDPDNSLCSDEQFRKEHFYPTVRK